MSDSVDDVARGDLTAAAEDGALSLRGWVVGNSTPIEEIEIADQAERLIARVQVNRPRPDLAQMFERPQRDSAGFSVTLEPHGTGDDELVVRLICGEGHAPLLASIGVGVAVPSRRAPNGSSPNGSGVVWSSLTSDPPYWSVADIGESRKVLTGRDGWLFLQGDANDVIGQHTGRVRLGRRRRRAWRRLLARRRKFADERDVAWLCLVIPDKEAVYPEHMPASVKPAPQRPVHEFMQVAKRCRAPVVYALPHLETRKGEGDLYARTDTHWNHRGSYAAYRLICDRLRERGMALDVLEPEAFVWSEETIAGDLGGKMHPGPVLGPMLRASPRNPRARLALDNGVPNHGRVWMYEQAGGEGPTCVMFGESFAENLIVFLKETFRRLVVVHTSMFVPEILEREQADVALSLPLERFLVRVPDDDDALRRLTETAQRKGGELPWTL